MFPRIQKAINRRKSQRRFAARIAREVVVAIRPLLEQQNVNLNLPPTVETHATHQHLQNFLLCDPPKFSGNEGAPVLLQWIENIERVFSTSKCPQHFHVKYASILFRHQALTWWNQEKKTRGRETSHSLSWDVLKSLLLAEFGPQDENQNFETEKEPEKPIPKKRKAEPSRNPSMNNFPHPTPSPYQYYPQPTFVQPTPPKRRYTGNFPLCAICGYHHPVGSTCRWCHTCNRYGHDVTTCRECAPTVYAPTPLNVVYPICLTCGEQTHLAKDCPNNH